MGADGRIEDLPLITGQGCYSADLRLPGQVSAAFVRSPHASARILDLDGTPALAAPGVLAVFTAADMDAAGVGTIFRGRNLPADAVRAPHRPALAAARVHHVGEPVALVVAGSAAQARDAAELVAVDYEALPAVADVTAATARDAPQLWPEAPGNVAFDWPGPVADDGANAAKVERIFAAADHVARITLTNQRLVVASLEPRGATADYDRGSGRLTLHCGTQGVSVLRGQLAAILGIPRDRLRVISRDIGGAFGMKTPAYPEYAALLVAARTLGRPVRWTASRSESFVSDNQARDTLTEAELALDHDGRFLALRIRATANMGAFLSAEGAFIATVNFGRCFPTVYYIPGVDIKVRCVFTNTLPTGPYRGAGRPEANYAMERLVDEAARLTGIDRIALRRRNMIAAAAMPCRTAVGTVYDSGEFEIILDKALLGADHAGFAARRAASQRAGMRRGIGVSCFLEHAGGKPSEPAAISFPGNGTVEIGLAVQSSGQGHKTVFTRLAARQFGIAEDRVVVRSGDTDLDLSGFATVASRSAMVAGSAIAGVAELVLAKGRRAASLILEAAESDIEYDAGHFTIAGTDRGVSLFEVAARATELHAEGALAETLDSRTTAEIKQSFPNGCHIAEVEIDPETGVVTLVSYVAVDDCGTVLDHILAEGQIHGGIAQGVGQALLEQAIYGAADSQLVTGSFMDYALPRADDLPPLRGAFHAVPCRTNPLGVKGVGEAGTTAALAAVMNAVVDALPGGQVLDMPATPEKIWRACRDRG